MTEPTVEAKGAGDYPPATEGGALSTRRLPSAPRDRPGYPVTANAGWRPRGTVVLFPCVPRLSRYPCVIRLPVPVYGHAPRLPLTSRSTCKGGGVGDTAMRSRGSGNDSIEAEH